MAKIKIARSSIVKPPLLMRMPVLRVRHGQFCLILAIGILASNQSSQTAELAQVYANNGNIFVEIAQQKRQLTRSGRDSEPILSPDGRWIVYTRLGGSGETGSDEDCRTGVQADELRRILIDGSRDETLMRGETGAERHQNVCNFKRKQFTSDGGSLFFLTPGWVTSSALHSYNLVTRSHRYVMPANGVIILHWCADPEHRDDLVVLQHRYFLLGGSYDWWWLFDRTGKRELHAIGDFDQSELKSQLEKWWCQRR